MGLDKSWKIKAFVIEENDNTGVFRPTDYLEGIENFKDALIYKLTKTAADTTGSHFDGLLEAIQILEGLKADE